MGRSVVLVARVGGGEVERAVVEAQLALAFALSTSSSPAAWGKREKVKRLVETLCVLSLLFYYVLFRLMPQYLYYR